jgi:hypothetical protein
VRDPDVVPALVQYMGTVSSSGSAGHRGRWGRSRSGVSVVDPIVIVPAAHGRAASDSVGETCRRSRGAEGVANRSEAFPEAEVRRWGRYRGDPTPEQLSRFFTLAPADLERVDRARSSVTRLGYAVQLGTVRFLGAFGV